jgi:hypothetical protein
LVFESLETSSRVAQLEVEIAQLKDALAPAAADRSGDRAAGPALRPSPRAGWSLLVRVSQNGHVKVRNIAQAIINAHRGRLSPAEVEILSVIEMHNPDGARLIGAEWTGSSPPGKVRSDRGSTRPCA